MGKIFITSDWHLNHSQPFIWQARGFNSVEEMNSELIRRHNKLVTADDDVYVLGDLFIHCILTLLNGVEVGGVGKLTFLDDMSRYSAARSTIGNNKTFTGVQLYMAVDVGDAGTEDGCRV